jgi:hypothetical protein
MSQHLARVLLLRGAPCARAIPQDKVLASCGMTDLTASFAPEAAVPCAASRRGRGSVRAAAHGSRERRAPGARAGENACGPAGETPAFRLSHQALACQIRELGILVKGLVQGALERVAKALPALQQPCQLGAATPAARK